MSAGGGIAPRRNNSITVSATKGKPGSESRSEEGDTRIKRKTTRRKDKRTKRNKEWDTENDEKEREKTKKERKKRIKKGKRRGKQQGVSGRYHVDYLGLNKGDLS